MSNDMLEARLRSLILIGYKKLTADDITICGAIALDPEHAPNKLQNGIGSAFRSWAHKGWIKRSGRFIPAQAPHRKGGMIQVWYVTDEGREWAQDG